MSKGNSRELEVVVEAEPMTAAEEPRQPKVWAGTRLVALVATVAVVSLLAGVALMQFIVSPAELASRTEPPEPGPVTATIEDVLIENTIITRGEVTYADPVQVTIDTAFSEGRPIVTGQVPKVGAVFEPASVALEVTGRPVIVLPGELPSYRSLAIGMRGPDVYQLKQALAALGYWAGDPESDLFEWDTATAVGEMFQRVGYSAPTGGPEAAENLRMAQNSVRSADATLSRANAAWNAAAASGATDLSMENADITEARAAQSDAYAALEEAQIAVQPTLPSGEVLFMPSLPRRVDEVFVTRGGELDGPAMMVSGATLTIQGTVSAQDAELLKPGMDILYSTPGGEDLTAEITAINAPSRGGSQDGGEGGEGTQGNAGRYELIANPGSLSEDQISELRGTNVRITIPVASTDGAVLAVPLAALSASPDGGNRIEMLTPSADDPFATETVAVSVGLAAGGLAEIESDDPRVKAGAKVVVGR